MNRKFIHLLTIFDKNQVEKLIDFLKSPYFNKKSILVQLVEYWSSQHPEFNNVAFDLDELKDLFPELSDWDEKRLNHHYHYLLELTHQFLALESLEEDDFELKIRTQQVLRKWSDSEQQQKQVLKQLSRMQSMQTVQDADYYLKAYRYYEELDQCFLLAPKRIQDPNLQLKSDHLDVFYIISKLKIACDMQSRNEVIQSNYQAEFLDAIEKRLLGAEDYLRYPAIKVYFFALRMLRSQNEEDYLKLKLLLKEHEDNFRREELRTFYDYAENFCIRQINIGQSQYYEEFFSLYQSMLKADVLLKEGCLEEWDYKNIVTAGIRTGNFEWTERFMRKNKKYLKAAVRENAYCFNCANFYYEQQRYREALQQLHELEFTDPTYQLGAKLIQLKSYYELNEFAAFEALIQAFRANVKRLKSLSQYRRQAYLHFLKIANQLGKVKRRSEYSSQSAIAKALKKIEQDLDRLTPLASADWLQQGFSALL